jgi:hypothetical protein
MHIIEGIFMRILKYLPAVVIMMASWWTVTCNADDSRAVADAENCLSLWLIDDIDIVDDQAIVFNTKSKGHFVNRLPQACPMLDRNRAILYRTPLSSLCKGDIITVLDVIGGGFQSLGACGLGKFQQVSDEEFNKLRGKPAGKSAAP